MNRRIVYTRPDGRISIVTPSRNIDEAHMTDDEIFQRALSKLPADAINLQTITFDQIPNDRTFRNAWEHSGNKVQVNMNKAREIHMNQIREVRDKKLASLDVETIKALGSGNSNAVAVVEAQKQKLRDIPQTLDLTKATTPEELKAIWPEEL